MVIRILVAVCDLDLFLLNSFCTHLWFFRQNLNRHFWPVLNVLIALEILENITAYLRKHVVQVELVIVTITSLGKLLF